MDTLNKLSIDINYIIVSRIVRKIGKNEAVFIIAIKASQLKKIK
ncbi:MAG: hypothetical protein ACXWV6_14455 [Chitinophagaceae bacterium]